jgi:undecaprenyl-diphosphatase
MTHRSSATFDLARHARGLLGRLGPAELKPLLWTLLVLVGTWVFLGLAEAVREGETHALDERVIRALREPGRPGQPIGPRWLRGVMRDFTALGSTAVHVVFVVAVCGYLAVRRDFAAVVLVGGATLGGQLLVTLLKDVFDRPRPDAAFHLVPIASASFPSGHSMNSAIVYLTLGALLTRLVSERRLKLYFLGAAMFLSFLAGISRVYLGVHYPSDVLAGWTAGVVWAVLWWSITRYLQRRGSVERER